MAQTIVCMKWGTRYGPDFVNRLWSMILRNTRRPTRLVCYTEDATGIDPAVEAHPLLPIELPEPIRYRHWRKIALWAETLPGLEGEALYLDLDIVITGPLDDFFDYEPGKFCVIRNWTQPGEIVGNTTAYRFRVGSAPHLLERMEREPFVVYRQHGNSQTYVTREVGLPTAFWPESWCVSFKHSLMPRWPLNFVLSPKLPRDARIVAFTGKPDPDEALEGRWPSPWYKRVYKHVRPTPWIGEHWR
jgi:hypothetical protein